MAKVPPTEETHPRDICFLNCFNARLFVARLELSDADADRLRALLDHLQDFGMLLLPDTVGVSGIVGLDSVLTQLRADLGVHIVEAALAAGAKDPHTPSAPPAAIMPIWEFLPEGDDPGDNDVLLSSGRLWGVDIMLEALRVEGDHSPEPVATVRSRYKRWIQAAGGSGGGAMISPPGVEGSYALFAASAAG